MKNEKLKALIVGLKNSLAEETKAELQSMFDAAIAELEADTTEISINDAIAKLQEKFATKQEVINALDSIKNKHVEQKEKEIKNYLNSKQSLKDFFQTIKNSTKETVSDNWKSFVNKKIKNDVDPDGVLLPAAIVKAIKDGLSKQGSLFPLLNHTGLKVLKIAVNQMAEDLTTSRAARHKKGETKLSQEWDLVPKTIQAQVVFKLLAVDYETLRNNDNEAALVSYINKELLQRWVREVERAILVGDGRSASDATHISSFETIVGSGDTFFTEELTVSTSGSFTIDDAVSAVSAIESEGELVFIASKQTINSLRRYVAATGGTPQYRSIEDLAGELGVSKIIVNRHVNTSNGAYCVVLDVNSYSVVGDMNPETIEQYDIWKNQNVFELVGLTGGGLTEYKSASYVVA